MAVAVVAGVNQQAMTAALLQQTQATAAGINTWKMGMAQNSTTGAAAEITVEPSDDEDEDDEDEDDVDDEGEPDEPGAEYDTMVEDSAIAHMTDDDETLKMIGLKLGIPAPRLLEINKPLIKGLLNIHQKMKEGTRILLRAEPQVEDGGGKRRRTGGKSKGGGKATEKAKGAAGGAAVDHASAWVHPAVFACARIPRSRPSASHALRVRVLYVRAMPCDDSAECSTQRFDA